MILTINIMQASDITGTRRARRFVLSVGAASPRLVSAASSQQPHPAAASPRLVSEPATPRANERPRLLAVSAVNALGFDDECRIRPRSALTALRAQSRVMRRTHSLADKRASRSPEQHPAGRLDYICPGTPCIRHIPQVPCGNTTLRRPARHCSSACRYARRNARSSATT